MKKWLLAFLLLPPVAHAQMFDFSGVDEAFEPSIEFADNLENCTPYSENRQATVMGVATTATYTVNGLQEDDTCAVSIVGTAEHMGVNTTQNCRFSAEDLEILVPAIRAMAEGNAGTTDEQTVENFLLNDEKCSVYRPQIDTTAKLRQNLFNCRRYREVQQAGPMLIERKILGRKGLLCQFEERLTAQEADLSQIGGEMGQQMRKILADMAHMQVHIKCKFNKRQLREFAAALEAMIVPEANSAAELTPDMQTYNPRAEAEFLQKYCQSDIVR